jgi:uncharacterized protein
MRYNVAQLIKGPTGAFRQYDLEADIRNLDSDLHPVRPLVGSVTLLRTSQGILVTARLQTRLETECMRCLEPCDVDVELDLQEEFYPTVRITDAPPVDDLPDSERDEALQIDEHHILDLTEVVRQDLWLALPMEALCRPDCAGICPSCGGNRNLGECQCDEAPIDPRWAALQALITNQADS